MIRTALSLMPLADNALAYAAISSILATSLNACPFSVVRTYSAIPLVYSSPGLRRMKMTSWVADCALPGGVVLTSSRWTMVAFASAALTATLPAPRCSSRMVAGCSGRASRTAPDAGRVASSGARRTGGALSVRDAIRIRPASHRTDRAAKAFAGPILARSRADPSPRSDPIPWVGG